MNHHTEVVKIAGSLVNMVGIDTHKHFPQVHVLMLTIYDSELSLIRLLQAGVKGSSKRIFTRRS